VAVTSQKKILTAVIGLAGLAALAAWQFYLFVVFKDADWVVDVQGGTLHLWMAIAIGFVTCVAGVFLISSFRRYDTQDESTLLRTGGL
jgi:hypothetical protein